MKKLLLPSAFLIFACSYGQGEQLYADGTATDQDGNSFEWISYGSQDWAIENTEVVNYRDGTEIPQVTSNGVWADTTTGAWCYYNNDPTKPKLYNWYANANLIKDEILQLRDEGATVIFSTHRMESVEELCDHIALIHESKKILDGKLIDIKRNYKTNTFEVGLLSDNKQALEQVIKTKFKVSSADFKSLDDDLKLNISLGSESTSNDLLAFLTSQAQVLHFKELIPNASDIFIQTIQNNKS
mgnify:CR=1 FL=1